MGKLVPPGLLPSRKGPSKIGAGARQREVCEGSQRWPCAVRRSRVKWRRWGDRQGVARSPKQGGCPVQRGALWTLELLAVTQNGTDDGH